jgi:hypothetical protein
MRRSGACARALELADVCYANDFCSSLAKLGMREAILEARGWDSGEEYLIRDKTFAHLIRHLSKGLELCTKWPVQSIEWKCDDGARIHGPNGEVCNGLTVCAGFASAFHA